MQIDLLSDLRLAYNDARDRDDRHGMDVAAQAISYAASGERMLACALAAYHRGWMDRMMGRTHATSIEYAVEYGIGYADAGRRSNA